MSTKGGCNGWWWSDSPPLLVLRNVAIMRFALGTKNAILRQGNSPVVTFIDFVLLKPDGPNLSLSELFQNRCATPISGTTLPFSQICVRSCGADLV